MRRRRLVAGAFGAAIAAAFVVAYLVRPVDELAAMMRFHPEVTESRDVNETMYSFRAPPDKVLASIPGARRPLEQGIAGEPPPVGYDIVLPSGVDAEFLDCTEGPRTDGITCVLTLTHDDRPWYERTWSKIGHRLNLW
jgi:hypothetical protein